MKQRIIPAQLQELTEEQKDKLREWWNPQKYDYIITVDVYEDVVKDLWMDSVRTINEEGKIGSFSKDECLPLLSIGQMIELLVNKAPIEIASRRGKWEVLFAHDTESAELADALWGAVKAVL